MRKVFYFATCKFIWLNSNIAANHWASSRKLLLRQKKPATKKSFNSHLNSASWPDSVPFNRLSSVLFLFAFLLVLLITLNPLIMDFHHLFARFTDEKVRDDSRSLSKEIKTCCCSPIKQFFKYIYTRVKFFGLIRRR